MTDVPRFKVRVLAATAVATIKGDGRKPSLSWWCSPKKQESNPASSASCASRYYLVDRPVEVFPGGAGRRWSCKCRISCYVRPSG